ncbi:MAG: desulfoferrodoxin [Candidatus Aminicenantes bacterium]|nr:desulfoferrodoxin [Candidatus Aminicenantes bacterium]
MAGQGTTYVCEICGREVRVEKSGAGKLVCGNRPLAKKEE